MRLCGDNVVRTSQNRDTCASEKSRYWCSGWRFTQMLYGRHLAVVACRASIRHEGLGAGILFDMDRRAIA